VHRLAVPVYLVDGADEVPAWVPMLREWFDALDAPRKEHIVLPDCGHRSMYQRPADVAALLTDRVAG
jgi:pimeloyl-ACP methyl ester carboxylesterase